MCPLLSFTLNMVPGNTVTTFPSISIWELGGSASVLVNVFSLKGQMMHTCPAPAMSRFEPETDRIEPMGLTFGQEAFSMVLNRWDRPVRAFQPAFTGVR